jgi:hypothetical protein
VVKQAKQVPRRFSDPASGEDWNGSDWKLDGDAGCEKVPWSRGDSDATGVHTDRGALEKTWGD